MVSISQGSEELRLYNLDWNLTISNPGLKAVQYFKMHLLDERFIFRGRLSGFSERGSQNLSNGTNVAS
jgi:hypothetical protein